MNAPQKSPRPILRALLIAGLFLAALLAFTVLVFVIIEIGLFVFITASNYQFANHDTVFLTVCLLSLISGLIVTLILFTRESFFSPRPQTEKPLSTEKDNAND